MPIEVPDQNSQIYRLDLLPQTAKFNTTSIMESDNSFTRTYAHEASRKFIRTPTHQIPSLVNLNIDKDYFKDSLLKNSE